MKRLTSSRAKNAQIKLRYQIFSVSFYLTKPNEIARRWEEDSGIRDGVGIVGKFVVAPLADIPPGTQKRVHVAGRDIAVFNVGGELFGISDACPHQGGSLSTGTTVGLTTSSEPGTFCHSRPGEFVRCPWHSWEFDLRTGQSWCDPRRFRTKAYDLSIEPGETLVAGPYVLETFGVSVEDQYVVVEF